MHSAGKFGIAVGVILALLTFIIPVIKSLIDMHNNSKILSDAAEEVKTKIVKDTDQGQDDLEET